VFSTNIAPRSLADEATLRRLYFKIRVPTPTKEDYISIFENACAKNNIVIEKEMLSEFYDEFYQDEHMFPSGHHPEYIMDHVISACDYLQIDKVVSKELLAYGGSHLQVN
jgi:SpoVK/Ycf46/Vps4 family AAA+-type ATPase